MEKRLCLSAIKAEYKGLTVKEKQVADFVLQNAEAVVSMPIGILAERAGVVKSVVIRCCKSLGFSGYLELKLSLSRELARNEQFEFTPYISNKDGPSEILHKIFSANIKTLHDTARGLDRTCLAKLVDLLSCARNIYIYGIGTSAGIVSDFQYRLMQLGHAAFCFTDIASMKVSTLNIQPGDVAIGISNSGRTVATVDTLRLARERGAKTACITSYPSSDIIKESDYPLVIFTDEIQYPIEAISARIAHISVLDAIAVSLSAKNYEEAVERAAQTRDLIDTVRY
ncbi:MAG: MurR/RpiR family transcriptional regulator [Ruminococcaceae bacterium]|nr:MurR/RpiR family transcriptional regulator [Oscillospiraceae bacterium]